MNYEDLRMDVPGDVKFIIKTLEDAGFEAYAVGGCVRDICLGRTPNDWDVTTSARPEKIKSLFRRTVDTGIKHGTVTVLLKENAYEVTTYRVDGAYTDGRHPEHVTFTSTLQEDLKRRDFTINAMAYHPQRGLFDPFGGRDDCKRRVIRCVGQPEERFGEDALRMMRAVRFSAQLGFDIDKKTEDAISGLSPRLRMVSAERITAELIKILTSDHPGRFLLLYELGLTAQFLPEFDEMMGCSQNTRYHCYTVGMHTIKVLENAGEGKALRLAALLHDVGKLYTKTQKDGTDHFYGHAQEGAKKASEILRRLKLDNDTIKKVCVLVRNHDPRKIDTIADVRRLTHEVGHELMPDLICLMRADLAGKSVAAAVTRPVIDRLEENYKRICADNDCVFLKDLAVNGADLINAGLAQGAMVGKVLNHLLECVMDHPEKNERSVLLDEASDFVLKSSGVS